MKKPLDVCLFFFFLLLKAMLSFHFAIKVLKDQKSLESLFFFLLLRVFKLFYYVSEMLNDWYAPDQYENAKWTLWKRSFYP
jgi:hypothetical protein